MKNTIFLQTNHKHHLCTNTCMHDKFGRQKNCINQCMHELGTFENRHTTYVYSPGKSSLMKLEHQNTQVTYHPFPPASIPIAEYIYMCCFSLAF